ncbi:hypothetical protein HPB49_003424 [Dermacentor silvarum]|uniref:Uncharacterized protein n=1 Tax=Dermacentor silvarum TaxID=543639 RepID=A0ACB8DAL3_DERSI|nr:hypothetical protein HPB49_003424 [Dermacentor silvarum]
MKRRVLTEGVILEQMRKKNSKLSENDLKLKINDLPTIQQSQVMVCFNASKRKSAKGFRYQAEWILECMNMRMKSKRRYEHLRKRKIMLLPGRTCLQRYLHSFKSGYGFSRNVFVALREKCCQMPEQQCHGGIISDEIKLSESLSLDHYGNVDGLVDLGQFSSSIASMSLADHALVVLFQPLTGKWHQVLGAFASRGNVKADVLTRIIVEAVIMLENYFLRVDFFTTDAAAWNRSMWRSSRISGKIHRVISKTVHPVDSRRHLHFISDFPHLIKNVRNSLLKHPFTTPEGTASINHVRAAWARDQQSSVTLKTMPRVHKAIVRPDGFEKMRVNYAFRLFSDEIRRGLLMYREEIQQRHGSATATEVFIKRFQDLISIMTSRFPAAALRANSKNAQRVSEFFDYLDEWERTSEKNGFISASTAEGLRVTLSGTLSLLEYVTSKLGFRYLMTSRLSQDILEQVFAGVPEKCKVWRKAFAKFKPLRHHVFTYTDEKQFRYEKCSAGFVWKSSLKKHLLTRSEEMPHRCQECGKAFVIALLFLSHRRAHTGENR